MKLLNQEYLEGTLILASVLHHHKACIKGMTSSLLYNTKFFELNLTDEIKLVILNTRKI